MDTRRLGRAARALIALCLLWVGSAQAASALHGAWSDVRDGDTPAAVLREFRAGHLHTFDPARLYRLPQGDFGSWVVLTAQPPWTEQAPVLVVYPSPMGRVTLYDQNGPSVSLSLDDFSDVLHGHGRLAFRLPASMPPGQPILLKFEPSATVASPVTFKLQTWNSYLASDAQWLAFASACFAVMLAMALMALCFALMLRDVTFGWYAGYIICYAVIQGVQTGFLFHPLGLEWLVGTSTTVGSAAVALSVAFASLFMARFCGLQRYAPILRIPVMALAIGMVQVVLLRCSHVTVLEHIGQLLINPLLLLGAVLLLLASSIAALRGSRHGWFFLAGWTPLLALTAMTSAQVSGALSGLEWLNDASLAAGAFEAIVLSIGLADRALIIRRDRDNARVLADKDSLTQMFNRRAWSEAAIHALSVAHKPMALLFLDLDHFKILNDRRGHAAGDHALIAVADALRDELRPADLLGRYGGEEFVALLDGASEEEAMQVATRLCRRVHRLEIPVDNEKLMLTISIGVALRRQSDSVESLVERADKAMYDAKLAGRNHASMYKPPTPEVRVTRSA